MTFEQNSNRSNNSIKGCIHHGMKQQKTYLNRIKVNSSRTSANVFFKSALNKNVSLVQSFRQQLSFSSETINVFLCTRVTRGYQGCGSKSEDSFNLFCILITDLQSFVINSSQWGVASRTHANDRHAAGFCGC